MKTRNYKMILMALLLGAGLIGCGSKKSSSNSNSATSYRLSGGICRDASGEIAALWHCGLPASQNFSLTGANCVDQRLNQAVDVTYCNSNPFVWNGVQCFDSYDGNKLVDSSYCSTSGLGSSNRYVLNNGYCFDSVAQQFVDGSYCGGGQQCYGPYHIESAGAIVSHIFCNGQNCAGYTLTNTNTGVKETCF